MVKPDFNPISVITGRTSREVPRGMTFVAETIGLLAAANKDRRRVIAGQDDRPTVQIHGSDIERADHLALFYR